MTKKTTKKLSKILPLTIFITVVLFATAITVLNSPCVSAGCSAKQSDCVNKETETPTLIDKYQDKYFTIIKRNNVLISDEPNDTTDKDRKELKNLYKTVEKQIKKKRYLKEYKKIEKRYSKCNEITTPAMNEFAQRNYNEVNELYNKIYNDVKTKLSPEDFDKLSQSETKWLKEVEDYKTVFDSMGFGTIGTIMYYDYLIDMKHFRMLLLMLYL